MEPLSILGTYYDEVAEAYFLCHETCSTCYAETEYACKECAVGALKSGEVCKYCEEFPGLALNTDTYLCDEVCGDSYLYPTSDLTRCDDGNL